MQEYTELYDSGSVRLLGVCDDCGIYLFRVELPARTYQGLDRGFSGVASFCFVPQQEEYYCKLLRNMYETLQGECLILDYDFGNELRLFFEGRQLKIEGKFWNGYNRLTFGGEDVDQTIILRIISLFQNK